MSLIAVFALLAINIIQACEATSPGRIYRSALIGAVERIGNESPPKVVAESWVGFFLEEIHLKKYNSPDVSKIYGIHDAKGYEFWLSQNQDSFEEGTLLLSGIGSCVHYGCHGCGFKISLFGNPLDSRWELIGEYGNLSYLPNAEPVRLYRWGKT